ncbi:MAG: O-antigen ligase family protein [Thermoleophilia bacterium]
MEQNLAGDFYDFIQPKPVQRQTGSRGAPEVTGERAVAEGSGESSALVHNLGLYLLMGGLLLGPLWSGGYFATSKWVLAVMLLSAGVWELSVALADGRHGLVRSPALWLFAVFTIYAAASVTWSDTPDGAVREAVLLAGYLGVFFVVRSQRLRSRRRTDDILLNWLVYAATFVSSWGIITYLLRVSPYATPVEGMLRAGSTFEYSNALSCFGLMALPVTLALFLGEERQERPLYATAATLQFAAVSLAFSRLGLVLLLAQMFYFLSVAGRRRLLPQTLLIPAVGLLMAMAALALGVAGGGGAGVIAVVALAALSWVGQAYAGTGWRRLYMKRIIVAAAVTAGLAAAGMVAVSSRARLLLGDRFGEGFSVERLLPHRQETWAAAWRAWQDRPVRGWGLGAFAEVFPRYQTAHFTRFAHNAVLQLAVDTGFIGAALITLFLGYVVVLCARSLPGRGDLMTRALAIGALAFIIYNMFDWEWYVPALTAWFMVVAACLESPPGVGER